MHGRRLSHWQYLHKVTEVMYTFILIIKYYYIYFVQVTLILVSITFDKLHNI